MVRTPLPPLAQSMRLGGQHCKKADSFWFAPCPPESARREATTGEAATKREEEKPQDEHEDCADPEDSDGPDAPPYHRLVELAPAKG